MNTIYHTENFSISDNSDLGWSERHKQNEINDRKMLANEMSEVNVSLAVSSRDSHIISNLECQKITQKESSPPDIFTNSSSLKYLHKKFKRVASTVIEDNCVKVSTNINKISVTESASRIVNDVNGKAFSGGAGIIDQSHINHIPATNNSHASEKYSEHINVSANESIGNNKVSGSGSGSDCDGLSKENIQKSHKLYATTNFSDGLNKCKSDVMLRRSTNTQNPVRYESLPEEFQSKTKVSSKLKIFDENLVRNADSKNACNSIESVNASAKRKLSTRRKNSERPNQCATCGIELKSKSQLYKHCRCVF